MNLFQSLSLASWAWKHTLKQTLRGSLWLPFLVLGVIQAAVLVFLLSFHYSWAQPLAVPLLRSVGGEAAIHYPYSLQVLPVAMARAGLVLSIVLASLMGGVATVSFARVFGTHRDVAPWRGAVRRYPALLGYTLIVAVVVVAAAALIPRLVPPEVMLENRTVRWGTRLGLLGLTVVLETLFAYGTAWIVLRGKGPIAAVTAAVRTAGRLFLPSAIVIALPAFVLFPLSYLESQADVIVGKFRPELVITVLVTGIVARILLGFLLAGSVTRLFLWREERSS